MIELTPEAFMTQILYRDPETATMVLGYIGQFEGGVAKRYKKNDPDFMYKDFMHSYKYTLDGVKWSRKWLTHSQAIRGLLKAHKKDTHWGGYHVIPIPQTFCKTWLDA